MKKTKALLLTSSFILFSLFLVACGKKDDAEQKNLQQYFKTVRDKAAISNQEARLISKEFQTTYSQKKHRNPFVTVTTAGNKTQKTVTGILDQYSLDSLRLVGTLQQDKRMWALIAAPNGGIIKVTTGNRISNQYTLVKKITDTAIILVNDQDGSNKELVISLPNEK